MRTSTDDAISETTPLVSRPCAEQRARAFRQFAALCICLFVVGWNDGSAGPLLPRMRVHYEACSFLAFVAFSWPTK